MEVTYIRAKVPNSFSRRMKLLCNTLVEHDNIDISDFVNNTWQQNYFIRLTPDSGKSQAFFIDCFFLNQNFMEGRKFPQIVSS